MCLAHTFGTAFSRNNNTLSIVWEIQRGIDKRQKEKSEKWGAQISPSVIEIHYQFDKSNNDISHRRNNNSKPMIDMIQVVVNAIVESNLQSNALNGE